MVKLFFKWHCEFTETNQDAPSRTAKSQSPKFFSLWPPKPTIRIHWYHLCKMTQITFVSGQHFLSSQYLSYSWRWFPKCSSGSRDPRPWLAHPGSPPWTPPAEQWLWIISSSSPLTGCQPAYVDGCTAQSPSKSCKTQGKLPKVVLQAWSLKIPEKNCNWKWKPALLSGHIVESPCNSVIGIFI